MMMTTRRLVLQAAGMWPSMVVGLVLGLLAVPMLASVSGALHDWYNAINPPATATLLQAERAGPDALRFRLEVQRHRDCSMVRLTGYSGSGNIVPADVLRREDGAVPDSYPAGERIVSRPWILMPWVGPRLLLYGYYECGGALVRATLVDQIVQP